MKRGFIYETVSEQDKKVMTGPAMNGVTSLRMTFEGICVQLVDFFTLWEPQKKRRVSQQVCEAEHKVFSPLL